MSHRFKNTSIILQPPHANMPKHTHTHMHTYENIYSHECMIFDTEKYVHIRTYAHTTYHISLVQQASTAHLALKLHVCPLQEDAAN